jgi:hypothetical protein
MKRIKIIIPSLLAFSILKAQDKAPEMADTLRQNGKIYVVVAIIGVIFAGIIIYLIRLDRKITRLENNS